MFQEHETGCRLLDRITGRPLSVLMLVSCRGFVKCFWKCSMERYKLNSCEIFKKKKKKAFVKFNSLKKDFEKKEKERRRDLEEAAGIMRDLSKKFAWWRLW